MFRKNLTMLTLCIALGAFGPQANAGCDGIGCDSGCSSCCTTCPQCNTSCKTCKLKIDEEEVSKHCWKVECEEICIPNFVWPWQQSCCNPAINNGSCVRTVKVLKKHSYKCPACSYSWSPEECGDCCDGCSAGGCDGCASGCDNGDWSSADPAQNWDNGGAGYGTPVEATPEISNPDHGSPMPAVPEAPSATAPSSPYTQPVNSGAPGIYHSTSRPRKNFALPVRFLRAAKAKSKR